MKKSVKDYIRTIPDFPHAGIMFRDVTTLFSDARGFRMAVDQLLHRHPEPPRIGKQRGHIAEHDPRMGKVGDGSDVVFDSFSHGFSLISSLDSGGAAP